MKTLKKNELKNILGGANSECYSSAINKTKCRWQDGYKICIGEYTWSGETLSLVCSDGILHTIN